jgi:hypothetical protein
LQAIQDTGFWITSNSLLFWLDADETAEKDERYLGGRDAVFKTPSAADAPPRCRQLI